MQKAVDLGALVRTGVSGVTDYLVVGKQDPKIVGADGKSSKERKANEFIKKGKPLKILSESELLGLLEL